jgi:hypothetical protein
MLIGLVYPRRLAVRRGDDMDLQSASPAESRTAASRALHGDSATSTGLEISQSFSIS